MGRDVKFYPYKKGGGGAKSFSHTEGGGEHNKFWCNFYAVAWSFSHIEGGRKVSTLKKGGAGAQKVLLCLEGGRNKFRTGDVSIL